MKKISLCFLICTKKGAKSQMFILLDLYEKEENLITVARFASVSVTIIGVSRAQRMMVIWKFIIMRFDMFQAF